jgi:hypothetical protein
VDVAPIEYRRFSEQEKPGMGKAILVPRARGRSSLNFGCRGFYEVQVSAFACAGIVAFHEPWAALAI